MNLKNRRKLIDEINDAFIEFLRDYRGRAVAEYIRKINTEIIERGAEIKVQDVSRIVSKHSVDVADMAVFSMILGAITAIIENKRMSKKQRTNLAPFIAIMAVYSIRKPKLFVNKVYKSLKTPKSGNERKVGKLLNTYKQQNVKVIEKIKTQQMLDLQRTQLKAKRQMSRDMIKDINRMTGEGRPLEMQRHWLKRKYNSNKSIQRAIDTEIHASLEKGKTLQAVEDGFTHKIWKTQEDDRVRKTRWHNQVKNKKIEIDHDFRVGSMIAEAPGDTRLPVGERINCRCYLIFK